MNTNGSNKLISSILILFIIFFFTISFFVGCTEEESTGYGPVVKDPDAGAAQFGWFVALGVAFIGKEIREKKDQAKAAQESIKENKAQDLESAESIKAEYEAQYDFKEEFLNTLIAGPSGAEFIESNKKLNFLIRKIMEAGAESEAKKMENQQATETTVPEQPDQATEEIKVNKGSITLNGTIAETGELEMIIDLDTGNVSGAYGFQWAEDIWPFLSADCGAEVSGKIDLETNAIEANCYGSCTWEDGDVTSFSVSMTGTLSKDNSLASGSGIDQDGNSVSWTATAQ
jgi:hypothetical protein